MKKNGVTLGYSIDMEKGQTWKPLKVEFWQTKSQFPQSSANPPFKYMGDALAGLALIKLNHYLKSPIATKNLDYNFVTEAWHNLDPHCELYDRSQPRVRALQSQIPMVNPEICKEFEALFSDTLESAIKPWGVDLSALCLLLDTFSWFEQKTGQALMYNFAFNFSKPFTEKLKYIFSFLYHLRGLVALDHNTQTEDTTHEGVRVDAIGDYLPRAEYIANDAMLYWTFKKYSQPFTAKTNDTTQVSNLFAAPMEKAFKKYSHNACALINNLPKNFVQSLNPVELEEALYLVQMDWLLGSPAGLLFKIREELYGIQSGYERIFWKDVEPKFNSSAFKLDIHCYVDTSFLDKELTA